MKLCHYPKIAPGEYDAFWRLILDLPENYEVWLKRLDNKLQSDEREDGSHVGYDLVDVTASEFLAWCKEAGSGRSLQSLYRFATDQAVRSTVARNLDCGTPQSFTAWPNFSAAQTTKKKQTLRPAKRRTARATPR